MYIFLGCMAERLKHKLIEKQKIVDIVAGPDSYKDLPNLLSLADEGQKAGNSNSQTIFFLLNYCSNYSRIYIFYLYLPVIEIF